MNIEIVSSADGSHTLFLPDMNETYHSLHGAITESRHVFIDKGLDAVVKDDQPTRVLEVGFGTGLNALLTMAYAEKFLKKVIYHTLEPNPLPKEIWEKLNYTEKLSAPVSGFYERLHSLEWNSEVELSPYFTIKKINARLEEWETQEEYDLVYFDAFAPGKQAEVWKLSNIEKCYRRVKAPGLLVSYCAQGQFRRDLQSAGFEVERLPGPPGKKEMLRAFKY